eukprot:CAMPEP_0175167368 /NCGR_PEP_ID=MMETSP0087-20121206/28303_1 /TAXON_ID=136419 /ORGANISM="Unknown Unknown, Strain D1" /LENGTH=45 /DNA_ID= /DNA_START= /DNA_END= /DNA_ORIENTATION=
MTCSPAMKLISDGSWEEKSNRAVTTIVSVWALFFFSAAAASSPSS